MGGVFPRPLSREVVKQIMINRETKDNWSFEPVRILMDKVADLFIIIPNLDIRAGTRGYKFLIRIRMMMHNKMYEDKSTDNKNENK